MSAACAACLRRAAAPLACGVLALLLAACASNSAAKTKKLHEAAAYNTQLGIAYMNQGDLSRAQDKLERALAQDPDNPDVHTAMAMLYARLNEPDKADGEFRAALRLAPKDPNVINNYAVYLCQIGRTDEGVKRFMEAAHNPLYTTPAAAYTNAGVCLHAAKRDPEAMAQFHAALEMRPNFAEAEFQLASLQLQLGDLAAARTGLDNFMNAFNANPDLLLVAYRVARAQNDKTGAQRYARKLQLDFPDSQQTRALATLQQNPG